MIARTELYIREWLPIAKKVNSVTGNGQQYIKRVLDYEYRDVYGFSLHQVAWRVLDMTDPLKKPTLYIYKQTLGVLVILHQVLKEYYLAFDRPMPTMLWTLIMEYRDREPIYLNQTKTDLILQECTGAPHITQSCPQISPQVFDESPLV